MDYLLQQYNRKKAKQLLKYNQILVNKKIVNQFDYLLKVNDQIEIGVETREIDIIYEDDYLIVINKPSGLLAISDGKEKDKTAYHQVSQYLKNKNYQAKVFVIHRLDRDTSGVLMFAKTQQIKDAFQKDWNQRVRIRQYFALVEGNLKNSKGQIKNYLAESKTQQVYISKTGKLAITNYQVIKSNQKNSLLKVDLETGRKNQIRVHLQSINHPIVGDKKYGAKTNVIARLGLHANKLALINPFTNKLMEFEAPIPKEIENFIK